MELSRFFAHVSLGLMLVLMIGNTAPQAFAQAPAIPTGLKAVAGDNIVTLTWTASAGATAYRVYRGTVPGGESATAIGSPTSAKFADLGAGFAVNQFNNSTYFYVVRAVNASGSSGVSSEVAATPRPVGFIEDPSIENSPSGWMNSVGIVTLTGPTYYADTGNWFAHLGGKGVQSTNAILQSINIPSTYHGATLWMYVRVVTQEPLGSMNDLLDVDIRTTNGTFLTRLGTVYCGSGATGYQAYAFPASYVIGKGKLMLYLEYYENSGLATSFDVDDVWVALQ